jgi:hypothetical protein
MTGELLQAGVSERLSQGLIIRILRLTEAKVCECKYEKTLGAMMFEEPKKTP